MSKPAAERRLDDSEALGQPARAADQRAQAQPRRPRDPRQECGLGAGRTDLFAPPHRPRREKSAAGGDRQRRKQPPARCRPAVCQGGDGRPGLCAEALSHPRPRPLGAGRKAFRASDGRRPRAPGERQQETPADGSESQSDRASARHQPHLGFALVRAQGVRQPAARRSQAAPVSAPAPGPGGGCRGSSSSAPPRRAGSPCIRRGRA